MAKHVPDTQTRDPYLSTLLDPAFDTPGASGWLFDVIRYRHLLALLLKKGTTIRYYGSVLGWLWSYVRPGIQFLMYYVVIGLVLKVDRGVEYYPVYLLAGITVVNLFSETLRGATNSITGNSALVKKVYVPRELFPVASIGTAFIHFLPQLILLTAISVIVGMPVGWMAVVSMLSGIAIVLIFALGLGLFFGAINVPYRDAKNVVDVILMFSIWASPVMYTFEMMQELLPGWAFNIYMINPITTAVELFHQAFWVGLSPDAVRPDHLLTHTISGLAVALGTLVLGQLVFRKLEGEFAQHL